MNKSETMFEFLGYDPISSVFRHANSALREVVVVGRASVDVAGSVAARLWSLFDPSDCRCLDLYFARHWELVAPA